MLTNAAKKRPYKEPLGTAKTPSAPVEEATDDPHPDARGSAEPPPGAQGPIEIVEDPQITCPACRGKHKKHTYDDHCRKGPLSGDEMQGKRGQKKKQKTQHENRYGFVCF